MADVKQSKMKQDIKGWQMLLIAIVFIVIGSFLDGAIGNLIAIGGFLFFLLSLARFAAESRAKKQVQSDKADIQSDN